MKKLVSLVICLCMMLSTVAFADSQVVASPSSSELIVDKGSYVFDAYVINENTYFKLRDVAWAFTYEYSGNWFDVTWDGSKKAINIVTKSQYNSVGGEGEPSGNAGTTYATKATSQIYVDGKPVELEAYVINQNTYFKLRDLGEVIDFAVDWDPVNNWILISTEFPYAG